jgi:hypothetical protein
MHEVRKIALKRSYMTVTRERPRASEGKTIRSTLKQFKKRVE